MNTKSTSAGFNHIIHFIRSQLMPFPSSFHPHHKQEFHLEQKTCGKLVTKKVNKALSLSPILWFDIPLDPFNPNPRYPPSCGECRVCLYRNGQAPFPIQEVPIPTYEESEALRILSLAKPLDPSKEQLEDLWDSTSRYICGRPSWLFRTFFIWMAKKIVEINPTDDAAELEYKYRKSISMNSSMITSQVDHRVIRADIVERNKSCGYHKRHDCYCGKIKLRSGDVAYFNWKAFLCEDRLEFY